MPKTYSDKILALAIQAITEGLSYREVSKEFGIPRGTLYDYVRKRSTIGVKVGRKLSIPPEVEEKIVEAVLKSTKAGFPMTKAMVLKKVGRLCCELKLSTQFKNGIPGDKYWRCLKQRFPHLTIRTPECCSRNRLRAITQDKLESYFRDLHSLIAKDNIVPEAIWNMNETGLQFQHKPSKVIPEKGEKKLYAKCSDSKETVTVLACVNAAGTTMPPMLITKGKTKTSPLSFATYLGPPGAIWTNPEKRWMENTLGIEWFNGIFLPNCGSVRPQLLLLDSHSSHEVLELLELAREERIHIFALPSHTTQPLRPLDTTIFKAFKQAYDKECSNFLSEDPSRVMDKKSFPLMLKNAWDTLKNPLLIKRSFATTGIYPPNPNAIHIESSEPGPSTSHKSAVLSTSQSLELSNQLLAEIPASTTSEITSS